MPYENAEHLREWNPDFDSRDYPEDEGHDLTYLGISNDDNDDDYEHSGFCNIYEGLECDCREENE